MDPHDVHQRDVARKSFTFIQTSCTNSVRRYSDLLSAELKEELGPVNLTWFQDSVKARTQKDQAVYGTESVPEATLPNAVVITTPGHERKKQLTPSIGKSPCLFSPDVPKGARILRKRQSTPKTIDDRLLPPGSPATPGPGGYTPGQVRVLKKRQHSLGISPLLPLSFSQPSYGTQSTSTKKYFKTPCTQAVRSVINSLGLDPNESTVSWTSSLATPPLGGSTGKGLLSITKSAEKHAVSEDKWSENLGAARMLFSPGSQASLSQDAEYLEANLNDTIEEEPVSVSEAPSIVQRSTGALVLSQQDSEPVSPIGGTLPLSQDSAKLFEERTLSQTFSKHSTPNTSQRDLDISQKLNSVVFTPTDIALGRACVINNAGSFCKKGLSESLVEPAHVSFDDVLSVFNTPPSRHSLRKRVAPKRAKRQTKHSQSSEDGLGSSNSLVDRSETGESLEVTDKVNPVNNCDNCLAGQGSVPPISEFAMESGSSERVKDVQNGSLIASNPKSLPPSIVKQEHECFQRSQDLLQTNPVSSSRTEELGLFAMDVETTTTSSISAIKKQDKCDSDTDPEISFRTPPRGKQSKEQGDPCKVEDDITSVVEDMPAFTQISPSSLSAICEVADKTESSQQDMFHDHDDDSSYANQDLQGKSHHSSKNAEANNTCLHEGHLSERSEEVIHDSKHPEAHNNKNVCEDIGDHGLFTQLSPRAEQAMLSVSEPTKNQDNVLTELKEDFDKRQNSVQSSSRAILPTPVKWKNCKVFKISEEDNNGLVAMNEMKRIEGTSPSMHKNMIAGTKIRSVSPFNEKRSRTGNAKPLLSLKRKGKRFSYPTFNQIKETCPRKVFNFPVVDISDATFAQTDVIPALGSRDTGDNDACVASLKKYGELLSVTESDAKIGNISDNAGVVNIKDAKTDALAINMSEIAPESVTAMAEALAPPCDERPDNTDSSEVLQLQNSARKTTVVPKPCWTKSSAGFTSLAMYNKVVPVTEVDCSVVQTSSSVGSVEVTAECATLDQSVSVGIREVDCSEVPAQKEVGHDRSRPASKRPKLDNSLVGKVNSSDSSKKPVFPDSSLEKVSDHSDKDITTLCGFQSASGKAVSISKSEMDKARKLINEEIETSNSSVEDHKSVGRGTLQSNPKKNSNSLEIPGQVGEPMLSFVGFQCASGKNINLSDEARRKAEELLGDIEADLANSKPSPISQVKVVSDAVENVFSGLSKKKKQPDSVLDQLSAEFDQELHYTPPEEVDKKASCIISTDNIRETGKSPNNECEIPGGKYMQILEVEDELKLNKCEGFVNSVVKEPKIKCSPIKTEFDSTVGKFIGFQSASGKAVKLSLEAQRKAEKLIGDVHITFDKEQSVKDQSEFSNMEGQSSVLASTHFIKSEEKEEIEQIGLVSDGGSVDTFAGFHSVSGKEIHLSALAEQKARQILGEVTEQIKKEWMSLKEADVQDPGNVTFCKPSLSRSISEIEPVVTPKDYSNVPKGFRPFKPPKRSVTGKPGTRPIESVTNQNPENSTIQNLPAGACGGDSDFPSNNIPTSGKPDKHETGMSDLNSPKESNVYYDQSSNHHGENLNGAFGLSNTQITEVSEGTAAFMLEADSPWTGLTQVSHNDISKNTVQSPGIGTSVDNCKDHSDICHLRKNGISDSDNKSVKAEHSEMCSFQTAGGKNVQVSDRALKNARKMIQEADDSHKLSVNIDMSEPGNYSNPKKIAVMPNDPFQFSFTTASGKQSNVSDKALVQARAILAESSEAIGDLPGRFGSPGKSDVNLCKDGGGDRVMSNNDIKFDKETKTAQFGGFDSISNVEGYKFDCNDGPGFKFQGFSTAKGTKVSVSACALKKAKALLASDEVDLKSGNDSDISTGLASFNKSNYKNVSSSCPVMKGNSSVGIDYRAVHSIGDQTAPVPEKNSVDPTNTVLSSEELCAVEELCGTATLPVSVGFQTASGKDVSISNSALKQARNLLESGDDCIVPRGVENASLMISDRYSIGFHTAAGNKVPISQDALIKAKTVLNNDNSDCAVPGSDGDQTDIDFQGFSTASGEKVTVSKSSLVNARNLMNHISSSNELNQLPDTPVSLKTDGSVVQGSTGLEDHKFPKYLEGFSTAGGKQVSISKSSLEKARNLLESVDSLHDVAANHPDSTNELGKPDCSPVVEKHSFPGFETAGGSKVSVSEKSLAQARQLLGSETCLQNSIVPSNNSDTDKNLKQNVLSGFTGFQTARGKSVSISSKALKHARSVLEDVTNTNSSDMGNDPIRPSVSGSCTGIISKQSLKHTREIPETEFIDPSLSRESSDSCAQRTGVSLGKRSGSVGFQTAGGTSVSVSGEALKKARKLLASEHELEDDNQERTTSGPGHETSSGSNNKGISSTRCLFGSSECVKAEMKPTIDQSNVKESRISEADKLDLSMEAAESAQALLADGVFEDNDYNTDDRIQLASVSTTPETVFRDRLHTGLADVNKSVISAPTQDVIDAADCAESKINMNYRWTGPTSYKFRQSPTTKNKSQSTRMCQSTPTKNDSLLLHQRAVSPGIKSSSGFMTPYKRRESGNQTLDGACKTPSKSYSQIFKTPLKRKILGQDSPSHSSDFQVHESQYISPVKKKSKLDITDDTDDNLPTNQTVIQEDSSDDSNESNCHKILGMGKTVTVCNEVAKERLKLQVSQAQRIKHKRDEGGVKPIPGSLYSQKTTDKIPLKLAVQGQRPQSYMKHQLHAYAVLESTISVCSSNAENFRFHAEEHFGASVAEGSEGVKVGDGALLIFDSKNTSGKEEFCNAFFDLDGVDPKLICRDWVYNQYRWIVWKLAALEVAFPWHFGGRSLNPDRVMLQLKYRYDREVDNSQRSALKKIYERDDTPAKTLVLCVSDILQHPTNLNSARTTKKTSPCKSAEGESSKPGLGLIEVTDGWYPIKVVLDGPLSRFIETHKLRVGDKICTYGAELVGSQDATPPLQAPADTMLKINANSTRRVPWSTKLGFHRRLQPSPLPLSSLYPDGGLVSCVDVVVTRVYPVQFMEKQPDGTSVFRGMRAEEKAAAAYEKEHQKKMELLYSKLQAEFEKKESASNLRGGRSKLRGKRWSRQSLAELQTGEELHEALLSASDPASVESCLNDHQMVQLADYRRDLQNQKQSDLRAQFQEKLSEHQQEIPPRNVVPLLKARLAGCANKDLDSNTNVMLTVWRPSDEVQQLLSEGKRLHIYNLSSGEVRSRLKDAARVSLTAQRNTRYQEVVIDDNFLDVVYEPREVTSLAELCDGFHPPFSEVDIVGVVVHVSQSDSMERWSGDGGHAETAYLADSSGDLCAVKFWGGLASAGVDDLISVKSLVAFGNLQWRHSDIGRTPLPVLTGGDLTTVSLNPRDAHLKYALDRLRGHVKGETRFIYDMQESLQLLTGNQLQGCWNKVQFTTTTATPNLTRRKSLIYPSSGRASPSITMHVPETPQSCRLSKTVDQEQNKTPDRQAQGSSTVSNLTVNVPEEIDLPAGTSGEEDPKLQAQKSLQKMKASKLAQYGTPPPLTNLNSPITSAVRRAFKPPNMANLATPSPQGRMKIMTTKKDMSHANNH